MPTTDNSIKQIIIGILILLFAGAVMGATGWNFTKVSQMPENYMKKSEISAFMNTNREDHIAIESKLDRLLELILQHRAFEMPSNSSISYQEEEDR